MIERPSFLRRELLPALAILIVGAILALGIWYFLGTDWRSEKIRIATGTHEGTYHRLGKGIAEILREELDNEKVTDLATGGSNENMKLLENGDVSLAFVQNDTEGSSQIRSVARLYQEILHIVVRTSMDPAPSELTDLKGARISVGPSGGGTAGVARKVLSHFDIDEAEIELKHLSPNESVNAFHKGEIDVIFVLSAIPSQVVHDLVDDDSGRLLSLGSLEQKGSELDGIHLTCPYLLSSMIPSHTYGKRPVEPVGTVGVDALLVTRYDTDPDLIRKVTSTIFANKVKLSKSHVVAAGLSEDMDLSTLRFPLHEGAESHYRRDSPSFFIEYAEVMSLVFSIFIAVASAVLAVKKWIRQTKKDRIDKYYLEIDRITEGLENASDGDLPKIRSELIRLRRRAFQDLVAEKIMADESFTIFQDYLNSELEEIHEKLHFKV